MRASRPDERRVRGRRRLEPLVRVDEVDARGERGQVQLLEAAVDGETDHALPMRGVGGLDLEEHGALSVGS